MYKLGKSIRINTREYTYAN